jgi:hypothetical protein
MVSWASISALNGGEAYEVRGMELDQAIAITINALKANKAADYGYDLYPPTVARLAASGGRPPEPSDDVRAREISRCSLRLHGNCAVAG